jgi:hypothetical protein
MTALASPPAAISDAVRKTLLVSLIADLSDTTIESLNDDELQELLRPLRLPFLKPQDAADLPTLSGKAIRGLMDRVRSACRRHFE